MLTKTGDEMVTINVSGLKSGIYLGSFFTATFLDTKEQRTPDFYNAHFIWVNLKLSQNFYAKSKPFGLFFTMNFY